MAAWLLKRLWWQQVLMIIAASVCLIHLFGFVGTRFLVPRIGWANDFTEYKKLSIYENIEGRFLRWDAAYYLEIAREGYQPDGDERAFFPLYPLLIRFVSSLSGLSIAWSSQIISLFFFGLGSIFLYRWVCSDYSSEEAIWAVIWYAFSPLAFFLIIPYAESLFITLSLAGYYFARRGQFIAAGAAIALAGAARPTAFLLAIPFFIEFWQQKNFAFPKIVRVGVGAFIAPLGTLGYLFSLGKLDNTTNGLAAYMSSQSAEWKRTLVWPWVTIFDELKALFLGSGINADWFSRVIVCHDFAYAIFGMASAVWSLFHIRLSAALYLLCSMIFFYMNHGPYGYAFWSIPRWVMTLFPIYLVMALWTLKLPKVLRPLAVLASIVLLALLSAWFTTGRWVS